MRIFILGCVAGVLVGGGVMALIVTQLDPDQAGPVGFGLFFLSLFVGVSSFMAGVGYGVRRLILARQFPAYVVRTSLRQGIMLGVFTAGLLFLQLWRLYRWWLALIIVVLFVSFELVFLSYDRSYQRNHRDTPA